MRNGKKNESDFNVMDVAFIVASLTSLYDKMDSESKNF